ncbi:MAG: hypothetical protein ACTHMS_19050 [Jatrophihabitans sp.]|uniref:hypothetical protein n=1 Tax=Jatrophihabitans sp. TaxID=1932789 RepID=UPI003F81C4C5
MTDPGFTPEEQRLAHWLQTITPEPPTVITLDAIAAHLDDHRDDHRIHAVRSPRRAAWLPALAAAMVVALVALALTWSSARHDSAPARPSPSRPITATPHRADPLPVHPWGARALGDARVAPGTTVTADGRLFAVSTATVRPRLLEIDPRTGATTELSTSYVSESGHGPVDGGAPPRPVVALDRVWYVEGTYPHGVDVESYPLAAASGGFGIFLDRAATPPVLAGGPDAAYIGIGRTVHIETPLGAASMHDRTFRVDAPVTGLAVAPDGTRLFVAVRGDDGSARLEVRDPATGRLLSGPTTAGPLLGLVGTTGGLWSTAASGNGAQIQFAPTTRLDTPTPAAAGDSGGGYDTTATVSGGAVWIGGNGTLACADPDSGRVRASVSFAQASGDAVYLDGVTVLGRTAVATVLADGTARVATLTPPAACFG